MTSNRTIPLTVPQLLSILDIDYELPIKDKRAILRQSHALRPESLGYAHYLMSTLAFKSWLSSPAVGVLVVNRHCPDMCIGKTSPMPCRSSAPCLPPRSCSR